MWGFADMSPCLHLKKDPDATYLLAVMRQMALYVLCLILFCKTN